MGSGTYCASNFCSYATSRGYTYDATTDRISGHIYTERCMNKNLDPRGVIRECCNSAEHPDTVPVILALDVTGSMGNACDETASAISQLMKTLYDKYKDVEIMIMGVGDFECDAAPLQVSQFESDVRVAEQLDQVYMEHGGGGNGWESYTAPWWFGLYKTKLDCFDKQGRKGVIITMGDEPLNPDLPKRVLEKYFGKADAEGPGNHEYIYETNALYKEASKKFDIFHIAIDDDADCYDRYKRDIKRSFQPVLGENFKVSTIDGLKDTICSCIDASIRNRDGSSSLIVEEKVGGDVKTDENGGIVW
jgi:hypothetical protein